MGKLETQDLKTLLKCIRKNPNVLIPPRSGFDSGVHFINGKCLVVSTDPCIGVPKEWFGWLLVNYAASDVALFGAKPEYCSINLLGSPSTRTEEFQEVMEQTCKATDEIGVAIVTGHTGTYPGLSTLVGVCTAYGAISKEKLITPDGARSGDYILCVKPIGLETIVNFAITRKKEAIDTFGPSRVTEISKLVHMQSCVKEALLLSELKGVHAMHDATEGGLTATLNEMADISGVGFKIEFNKIFFAKEMQKLKNTFQLSEEQMLSISSTGAFLAAIHPKQRNRVESVLQQNGIEASIIGSFTRDRSRILIRNGYEAPFPQEIDDPYTMILSGKV